MTCLASSATIRAASGSEPCASAALPLISVVTPSYNQGRFIERMIQSVLAQNYPNFEHVIYDNCSTDGTLDILRRYPHLDWVSAPDRGQSDALNKALRKARGEIIAWLNADDYFALGAFDLVARELHREGGVSVLLGRMQVVDTAGHVLRMTTPHFAGHESLVDIWSREHGLSQPGMFFRREVVERIGGLDESLHFAMDYDLWLRLTRHFPIKIVDAHLASFVVHPQSKTGQARYFSGFWREAERVSRRYWGSVFSRRYWRLAHACGRFVANALAHEILDAHKRGRRFKWGLVGELLRRRPTALCDRYLLTALVERLAHRAPVAAKAAGRACLHNGRVTVVVPTYNRAALVQRAIESVRRQTVGHLCDIVVVDDGSTDDTAEALRPYAADIRYLRQANAGVSAARNTGLRDVTSEFVAFLDSDDEWAPDKIERQLAVLRQYPEAVFVATHGARRSGAGEEWSPDLPPVPFGRPVDLAAHLFGGLFLLTSGVMVRTKHFARSGPFCTNLRMCEDYRLWLHLACRGPAIVLQERLVTCGWNAPASLADDVRRVSEAQIRARYLAHRELRRRPDCTAAWRAGLARLLALQRDTAQRAGHCGLTARLGFRSLMIQPHGRGLWEWGRLLRALLRLGA
jgi:glycosyltransferase involved in cell wall biosynthesis